MIQRHSLVGSPRFWKLKRNFQYRFLVDYSQLNKSDKLLDIGCGTLRGGIPLIKYLDEGNYHGIDIREVAIREGLQEIDEENLQYKRPHIISFRQFSELQYSYSFDKILAFSVLIHMDDEVVDECFSFVTSVLSIEGSLYANVNIESIPEQRWQEFPVMSRPISFYQNLAKKHGLVIEDLGSLSDFGHNTGDLQQDNQHMLKFSKSN